MTSPAELRLPVGWGELSALHWPNPGAPRILGLHGWMDNAASLAPLAPFLSDFDLVALELAGHGHSDHRPPAAYYHVTDNLYDLEAALAALGWESCHFVAHSLGGIIATMLAAAAPSLVERLVILDALGPITLPDEQTVPQLAKSMESVRHPRRHLNTYATLEDAATARQRRMPMAHESALLLAERGTRLQDGRHAWRTDPRLMWNSPQRMSEGQAQAVLTAVACPMLVVSTPAMLHYLGDHRQARQEVIAKLLHYPVEGSHHVHMEKPELVAPAILDFLNNPGDTE